MVPFQLSGQSDETVRLIGEDWLVARIVYVAVGVSTIVCAWARASRDLRIVQRQSASSLKPTQDAELLPGCDLDTADQWLAAHGYLVKREAESISAVKHRYSLLGGSLFHVGIVLFGVALAAHLATVDSISLRVTEGQTIGDAASSSGALTVPPSIGHFTLESIKPRYYKDVLLFTRLDARLKAADGSHRDFSLSRPYWINPTTVMTIGDYNLAPHLEITDPNGDKKEIVVAMNLSPPGAEDKAQIPGVQMDASIIAYPDYGVVGGRDVSLSYNIKKPAFMLAIGERGLGGLLVARKLVRLGEPVTARGFTVRITRLSRYGTFRITTAPALPFVALSLLMMTVGTAWRFLLRRRTVMVWSEPGGVLVDGWVDLRGRSGGRRAIMEDLRRSGPYK
jgi:hypothetical protein